jgi:hypothetical protein
VDCGARGADVGTVPGALAGRASWPAGAPDDAGQKASTAAQANPVETAVTSVSLSTADFSVAKVAEALAALLAAAFDAAACSTARTNASSAVALGTCACAFSIMRRKPGSR